MSYSAIMGNQRQVLKDNIEKELVSKIETAKDVLTQLNKNMEMSKQNSLSAKEEIRTTTDAMREALIQRKKELIREVENLHNMQARSLQDAMKSTHITMGKLQSMLTNLDSFDQSQLVKLQIPQVSMASAINERTQINVTLECDQLKEDLGEWGTVTADEFQSCTSVKTSAVITPVPSFSSIMSTPAPEAQKILSSCANKENQKGPAKVTTCATCPWSNWGVGEWLISGNSSRKLSVDSNNKDDFLMVSSPCSESSDMDFVVPPLDIENTLNQLCSEVHDDDGESGSSIICVEKDAESVHSDMSVWLKPKKSSARKDNDPPMKYNEVILSSDVSNFLSARKRNVTPLEKKRSVDFPCLRMETDNWVHKKKAKSTCSPSDKAAFLILNKEKLIPPNYALPNPFWLKKYQHQR